MFPHNEFCMQIVASVTFIRFLKMHNLIIYHPNSKLLGNYVERHIDCWILKFGRILLYLNVTLWTLNMISRKFKIYICNFHVHVAMKPFRIWTKWKQNPHLHDIVNINYAQNFKALSIFITKLLNFKVWKNYTIHDFCSGTGPTMCHEHNFNWKTIWSRKLKFWICSFG